MTDTRDPRYMRMIGLTLLAVLLVVASCQVEQLSINIGVKQTTPDQQLMDASRRLQEAATDMRRAAGAEGIVPSGVVMGGVVLLGDTIAVDGTVINGVLMMVDDGSIVLTVEQLVVPRDEEFEVRIDPVFLIDAVVVQGNIRQADRTIIAMGGLNSGSVYTLSDIQRATESMWATGQFKDVRVLVGRALGDDMLTLIWDVVERDLEEPLIRLTGREVSEEEILSQLAASGLSRAEVRAQLSAVGVDPAIADAYFDRLEDALSVSQVEPQEVRPEDRDAILAELQRHEAEALAFEEELQALRPEDRAAIQAGPVFTPYTVSAEITNRREVQQALMREYPPILRDAEIGGQVVVWFFISDDGTVLDSRVYESSGYPTLDAAALRVAAVFRFTPAMNRDRVVQVWIQLPITFQAN